MKTRTVLLILVALLAGGAVVYFALDASDRPREVFLNNTPPAPVRRTGNTSASYNKPAESESAESSEPKQQ
jgi:hypothetical protein